MTSHRTLTIAPRAVPFAVDIGRRLGSRAGVTLAVDLPLCRITLDGPRGAVDALVAQLHTWGVITMYGLVPAGEA